jgi:hypothetical protein
MKALALLCVWLSISCSPAKEAAHEDRASAAPAAKASSTATASQLGINAEGEPYGLRFEDGALVFCDTRGGRRLDLKTGQSAAADLNCKKNEPDTACSSVTPNVSVRAPLSEPNDLVDVDGFSFPLTGRVHDCAAEGKTIAIVTASSVVMIDAANGAMIKINSQGGDRVAIDSGWVAWTDGSKVNAMLRAALKKTRPIAPR